jgi:geranylgeranyl reductase family protein
MVRADVLVLGAGPAGSAAAVVLARGGARVVLVDRARFPRDKVCGDALLPDALAALVELGARDALDTVAHPVAAVTLSASSVAPVRLEIAGAVLPRERLDELVLEHAVAAGAQFVPGAALERLTSAAGRFTSARLTTADGIVDVSTNAIVLATGAARGPRRLAGLERRPLRSAAALRGYARLANVAADELLVAFPEELSGGYAWAFPCGAGEFNVGCGIFAGVSTPSLAATLRRWAVSLGATFEVAPGGAPLLTFFPRGPFTHANLAAVGDAAGLTRPLSGEGIGPALASGITLARELLVSPGVDGVAAYRRWAVGRWAREWRAWRFGEAVLRHPRLTRWVVAQAARYEGARRRCAAILAGTLPAGSVLSPLGLLRLFVAR